MKKGWSDQRVEAVMGDLLRTGVLLSAAVIMVGACIYLNGQGHASPHYAVFRGEPADLRGLGGVLRDAASGDGFGIIQLGLILLIATPVARVVFSVFAFAAERDSLYVALTLVVLAILIFGLAQGYRSDHLTSRVLARPTVAAGLSCGGGAPRFEVRRAGSPASDRGVARG